MMRRVFIGFDPRQPLAYTVAASSVMRHASVPVAITPLVLGTLPIKSMGLTEFTYSRFLVPWLCGYEGHAVFMDPDMIVTGDIDELFQMIDDDAMVSVMQKQARYEWASLMVFNNSLCKVLTPEFVDDPGNALLGLEWAGKRIGTIPRAWNYCVGHEEDEAQYKAARLIHYTQGIPAFYETAMCTGADRWQEERRFSQFSVPWAELMGKSVHAAPVIEQLLADRFGLQVKLVQSKQAANDGNG